MIIINSRVLLELKVLTLSLKASPLCCKGKKALFQVVMSTFLYHNLALLTQTSWRYSNKAKERQQFPAGFTEQVKL